MAKAAVFGRYERLLNFSFINAQKNFFRSAILDDPFFDLKITNKKYTLSFDGNDRSFKFTLKGDLNTNRPFNERTVKSVVFVETDLLTGEKLVEAKYSGLKNLTFEDFVDRNFDAFKESYKGNDTITGTPNTSVLLTGFKGNDKIFLESGNLARGGAGKDQFIFSKDTRNAVILDYNGKKDKLIIDDDFASNYRLTNNFGQLEVQNLDGDTIAFVNSFNDPDLLPTTQIIDFF